MTVGNGRQRFAIVEDEAFMAESLREMLCAAGMAVEIFPLGVNLLKSADLHQFRVIILDLALPDLDGFELMGKMASMGIRSSILLISGHSQAALNASQTYGLALGLRVCAAMCKPFSRDELFMALGLAA